MSDERKKIWQSVDRLEFYVAILVIMMGRANCQLGELIHKLPAPPAEVRPAP